METPSSSPPLTDIGGISNITDISNPDRSSTSSEEILNGYVNNEVNGAPVDSDDVFQENAGVFPEDRKMWLRKAISVCSEGEDLEKLALEADEDYPIPSPQRSPRLKDNRFALFSESDTNAETTSVGENGSTVQTDTTDALSGAVSGNEDIRREENETALDLTTISGTNDSHSNNDVISSEDLPHIVEPLAPPELLVENSNSKNISAHANPNFLSSDNTHTQNHVIGDVTTGNDATDNINIPVQFHIDERMAKLIEETVQLDDYIYQASLAMSEAIEAEGQQRFEAAFETYKLGIGFLLHGVQQDKDAGRREAVRRKTAQYLLRAESLYKTYLSRSQSTTPDIRSPVFSPNVPRSQKTVFTSKDFKNIQKVEFTLRDFKVLGIVDNIVLSQNARTDGIFAVKVLHKCGAEYKGSRRSLAAKRKLKFRNCKYMVKLLHFTETSTGIYLFLEYLPNGRLWDYLGLHVDWKHSEYTANDTLFSTLNHSSKMESIMRGLKSLYSEKSDPLKDKICVAMDNVEGDIAGNALSAFSPSSVSPRHCDKLSQKTDNSGYFRNRRERIKTERWIPEDVIRQWAAEIVIVLEDLHSHGIICK